MRVSATFPKNHLTKMSSYSLIALSFLFLFGLVSSHNILVFMPFGSHSHKATLIPLVQGLLE